MLPAWVALLVFGALVVAAWAVGAYGDRATVRRDLAFQPYVYALAIGACGGTWGVFSSIGMASRRGLDFVPIYLGPALLFAFASSLVVRVVRQTKSQNITSIADFVAIRYGKSTSVGLTIALVVTIGVIPYLGLQLQQIALALQIFLDGRLQARDANNAPALLTIGVTLVFVPLTIAITARRLAATAYQPGFMLVMAGASIVKIVAFVAVGSFVCWGMFHGLGDLTERIAENSRISDIIDATPSLSHWTAMVMFSFAVALVTPHFFYVLAVENREEGEIRSAAWLVPATVLVMGLLVLPIAAAGLATFPQATFDRDFTIFALPIEAGSYVGTLLALVAALVSGIATILVATAALAIIVSNDVVMPIYLGIRGGGGNRTIDVSAPPLLLIRRLAVAGILAMAWLCIISVPPKAMSSVAYVFVVCAIQVAPAAIGGLIWSRGTARGAVGGCIAGVLIWGYTLVLPTITAGTSALVTDGPLGFDVLRPTDLFALDAAPFDQGVLWSLVINTAFYFILSLSRPANANERLQASLYVWDKTMTLAPSVRLHPFSVMTGDLLRKASSYVGPSTAEPMFRAFHSKKDLAFDPSHPADSQLVRFTENLIASTIGAASSRTVISQLLDVLGKSNHVARRIVDDVSFEVQNSHDVLQHAIDLARDGMAVFDRDLRLVAWNRAYRDMFAIPPELMRIGVPLDVLVRSNAERGVYGHGDVDELIATRLEVLTHPTDSVRLHSVMYGRVFQMRSVRLHNGGLFFTYSDATEQIRSEADLEAENVTLERRVRERTEELQTLNFELARAKAEAEEANVSKTRFLAAASHDLLQPLNAARLYTTSLRERLRGGSTSEEAAGLASHIDESLEAVEDILGALLEISQLDAGATKTEVTSFAIESILRQLQIEFQPAARERGLRLRFVRSTAWVVSDRRLLSRLLQNLISNAIKYTSEGGVVVGIRNLGASVRIDVHDSGLGIPASKQGLIFREFERLAPAMRVAAGAGLGLSIVERLGRVLKHSVHVQSKIGQGSTFSVTLPRAEAVVNRGPGPLSIAIATRQRSLEGLIVAAIDNERHILAGMEILLQGWDCVVATGTGLRDIQNVLTARSITPDVILADFHIDETDGLGVIEALRERYGPCPAVLITADRNQSIRDNAQAADVRVLNKPLKPAALRALLSQWRLVKMAAE